MAAHVIETQLSLEQIAGAAKPNIKTAVAGGLTKIAPMPGPHKFYYGNSGAEAIECALKLARYHTKRQHVIAFFGAFHGRPLGALSLTASKPQQRRRFGP